MGGYTRARPYDGTRSSGGASAPSLKGRWWPPSVADSSGGADGVPRDTRPLQGHRHGHTIAGGSRGGVGNLSYGGNECHAIINHSENSAGLHQ
jgi:hypothetical protein